MSPHQFSILKSFNIWYYYAMKFDLKSLWNVTLFIFVLTIASNGIAIMYQQALLASYDINPEVINIQIDPGYLFKSVSIMLAIAVMMIASYLYFKAAVNIPKWISKFVVAGTIVIDVVFLVVIIMSVAGLINNNYVFALGLNSPIDFWVTIAFITLFAMYFCMKILIIGREVIKKKKNILTAYKSVGQRIYGQGTKQGGMFFKISTLPVWPLLIVLALFLVVYVPTSMAEREYRNEKSYTQIVKADRNSELKQLIILRNGDTFITKTYNEKEKKFLDSYTVIDGKGLEFENYTIN